VILFKQKNCEGRLKLLVRWIRERKKVMPVHKKILCSASDVEPTGYSAQVFVQTAIWHQTLRDQSVLRKYPMFSRENYSIIVGELWLGVV
jgi:hypothetical protein